MSINDKSANNNFYGFTYWRKEIKNDPVKSVGEDPRTLKRIRYKFQLGLIKNTGSKRIFDIGKGITNTRTQLQVHPDGGPEGSFGCNNGKNLTAASLIYSSLRWRTALPYFIEIKE